MSRRYTFVTMKQAVAYVGKTPVKLDWQDITPMTRDPTVRASMPGAYAIVNELDLVYILPKNRPQLSKR